MLAAEAMYGGSLRGKYCSKVQRRIFQNRLQQSQWFVVKCKCWLPGIVTFFVVVCARTWLKVSVVQIPSSCVSQCWVRGWKDGFFRVKKTRLECCLSAAEQSRRRSSLLPDSFTPRDSITNTHFTHEGKTRSLLVTVFSVHL